jgi:argininosuccinate lyase
LRRDHARLAAAADEADACHARFRCRSAGTSYAVDTAALATRLGFSRVVANSMDASSDRDFVSAFLHAVALCMVHLSRLAEDLILFTGEEHAFFELADSSATGSSMMPQKKNPDPLELVRGKTGRAIGRSTGWLVTMKGLPTGYNKDLQEDKEGRVRVGVHARGLAARGACGDVEAHVQRRALGARGLGLLLATDVADYLATHGMPFRRAHEVVGAMVRSLLAQRARLLGPVAEEWRAASDVFGPDAPEAATALASVKGQENPAIHQSGRGGGGRGGHARLGRRPLGGSQLTLLDFGHLRSLQPSHL